MRIVAEKCEKHYITAKARFQARTSCESIKCFIVLAKCLRHNLNHILEFIIQPYLLFRIQFLEVNYEGEINFCNCFLDIFIFFSSDVA